MKNQIVKIELGKDSRKQLKKMRGCKLMKVGYTINKEFSPVTALFFDDKTIKIVNKTTIINEEEYAELSFIEGDIANDIAYEIDGIIEKFEFDEYEEVIKKIQIVHDTVSWQDYGNNKFITLDMQCIVILSLENKDVVIFAQDTAAEAVELYDKADIISNRLSIQNIWPVLDEKDNQHNDVEYLRTLEEI